MKFLPQSLLRDTTLASSSENNSREDIPVVDLFNYLISFLIILGLMRHLKL